MLHKLLSGQGCPSKKHIFGHVTSLIGEKCHRSIIIKKNFPGLLHTPAKYEKNPPYGCKAIAKTKCGSGGVTSRDGVYYMMSITITVRSITITITMTFQIFKSITITLPSITSITFITFYYFVSASK